ncbi:MAG: phosphatase PAP2 family protein [Nanoarchaeota archaeon]|nr:phosphatase PAP2 family protein [Nanoarchaeota archaeon]MBU4284262.1 phosphatase PAP2 family protein [Nanoarchaeota archaeon]MBU4493160.1 phosphatase PAP2 family protein [Nanoarchaeota archaeon]
MVSFLIDNTILKIIPLIKNPILNYLSALFTNFSSVFVIIIVLISLFLLNKKKRKLALPLGISFIFSYVITYVLKFIIARPRPLGIIKTLPLINLIDYSFPSAHAAVAFAALPILNKTYPKLKWLLISSASFIAFSRIYIGVHYLSDVLAGAFIGYFTSIFITKLKERKWKSTGLR